MKFITAWGQGEWEFDEETLKTYSISGSIKVFFEVNDKILL